MKTKVVRNAKKFLSQLFHCGMFPPFHIWQSYFRNQGKLYKLTFSWLNNSKGKG